MTHCSECNYYSLAADVKSKLRQLEYLSNYSLLKTLAAKHKTQKVAILKRLKRGNEWVKIYQVKGEPQEVKVYKLKHLHRGWGNSDTDSIPNTLVFTASSSELVKRLNRNQCEYCGRTDLALESHHVRKLKDLKLKPNLKKWKKVMIARSRKTLVVCIECHDLLHAGKLPDKRYHKTA